MKIYENFHVNGIFHHDKSNKMKVYAYICLVRLFFRFVELYSARNQCNSGCLQPVLNNCLQVILCFCLFLIQNI